MLDRIAANFSAYNPLEVAFELAVIWIFVYLIFRFLEATRGVAILRGLAVVAIVVTVAIKFVGEATETLDRLRHIYTGILGVLATLLIVVFQPELRQAMVRLGEVVSKRTARSREVADEVDVAVQYLSKNQFGALLVLERTVGLGPLVGGGVRLEAIVSSRLLMTIFYPNSPLHDLAVVIRGDRVIAANVQLPLADVGMVSGELGSRHRAAVGVTMESDCIAVVVSEERGTIRIAERGRLSGPIPREEFRGELSGRLSRGDGGQEAAETTAARPGAETEAEPSRSRAPGQTAA